MGADTFYDYADGTDVQATFRATVDNARYEHGHGGGTGTIAEKGEFVIVATEPMTRDMATAYAGAMIHRADPVVDDKWGPAGAIPICADEPTEPGGRRPVIGWLFFGWASS